MIYDKMKENRGESMDDFKIGDDFDENGNANEHRVDKKIVIAIVIVISIIIGLSVFLVSNLLFGRDDDKVPVDTQVQLTDENVQILYKYVAYHDDGYGNDLFLKENSVNESTFKDEDKLYYVLQFVEPEELTYSGKLTDQKQKIYDLSISKLRNYTTRFFGKDISFTPVEQFEYRFNFTINDLGIAKLTYEPEEEVYKVVFEKEPENTEELVKPYYTELSSATKKADGTLILNEKVIYTSSSKDDGTYKINVYKDYQHTTLIEAMQSITEEDLKTNPISIDKYKERAATITYTFKINNINKNYYFDSSTITY